jgi:hypothetical protein
MESRSRFLIGHREQHFSQASIMIVFAAHLLELMDLHSGIFRGGTDDY